MTHRRPPRRPLREAIVRSASDLVLERIDPSAFVFPGILRRPRLTIVRPDDLLVVALEFRNLSVSVEESDGETMALLRRGDGAKAAHLIVHLQPQNVAEEAFFESASEFGDGANEIPSASLPISRTRIAGPSQLVFEVPKDAAIPYTIAGILDAIRALQLSVPPTALPPRPPPIFVAPEYITELLEVVARGVTRRVPPAELLKAKARLLLWEDATDLLPVTIRGELHLLPRAAAERATSRAGSAVEAYGRSVVTVLNPGQRRSILDVLRRRPRLAPPTETETALELPFRLLLSPNRHAAWVHAASPVSSPVSGRTELWHTRLATRLETPDGSLLEEGEHQLRTVRAVWARSGSTPPLPDQQFSTDPDDRPGPSDEPFRMSLDAADRFDIVHESANFNLRGYQPVPIQVSSLMLTALGAWIDSRGAWNPPTPQFAVEEWRHRGTMARDHYVRVVYKGYLFPFGHRASVVKVTERKLHTGAPGTSPKLPGAAAALRQRFFLIVRQPVIAYGHPGMANANGHSYDRQFPFTNVRITTVVTPNLDPPEQRDYPEGSFNADTTAVFGQANGKRQALFWPHVTGAPFPFHLVAEDLEGRRLEFTAPLAFISNVYAFGETAQKEQILTRIRNHYQSALAGTFATARLDGQRVALAEAGEPGDTLFEAETLRFGAEIPTKSNHAKLGSDRARFYPVIRDARIVVPVVKQFTGNAASTVMSFAEPYLKSGFPNGSSGHPNEGQVFLKVAASPIALDFSGGGDKAGAFVQPTLDIAGVSRRLGPVGGDLGALATGTFTPDQFFDALKARLFGVVELGEVIRAADIDTADLVPKFVTEAVTAVQAFSSELIRLEARFQALKAEADIAAGIPAALAGSLSTLESDLTTHVAAVSAAIDDLLGGETSVSALVTAVTDLNADLAQARTVINSLGPAVSSDVRQTLLSTLDALQSDVGDGIAEVAAFAARLQEALKLPEELTMRFEWKPEVQHWPDPASEASSIFLARNTKSGKDALFSIAAELQAKTKLRPDPRVDVACRLHNFTLNLIGEQSFLLLHFNKLEFTAKSGNKPDVNVEFDDIEFTGVLSFVEALRTLIPLDGFSDPPALDVSEKGIRASYSMALPDVAIGVFSLQNLSLGAGFNVPFLLDPLTVRFNFCERESPFLLTVSMFGGGGFFALTLDPDGVEMLEAAFEFGASLSVNFGVASGGITVMAGIYYKMEVDEATLIGYFRMAGEVDVLGLISACIELYLGLSYEFASGKCAGTATITVEVSIAFFSTSVSITCQRKFAGSNGDPTFAELMGPSPDLPTDPWASYCEAFA